MRRLALLVLSLAGTMLASEEFHRSTISGGFIAATGLGTNSFTDSLRTVRPGANFAYGLNLTPHITIETGVDWVARPLGSLGAFGFSLNAGDNLFLVPFGARYGFGPSDGKWRIYAGGGGAYAKHTFPTGASYLLNETGFGGYALAGADVGIGSHLRVGGVAKFYRMGQNSNLVQLGATPQNFVTFGPQIGFTF
jgi:hypothetical protein